MTKLRKMLTARGIEWYDESRDCNILPICRTKFEYNGHKFSVIHGIGTMGGFSRFAGDQGLLECWDLHEDEPTGGYTAEEVMEKVLGVNKI